jgi:arsenite methyltransferase
VVFVMKDGASSGTIADPGRGADDPDHLLGQRPSGDYGFDGSFAGLFGMAAGGSLLAGLGWAQARTGHLLAGIGELLLGVVLLITLANFIYATRRGKFAVWAELLARLPLRGDERILDVGCGRGAVLTLAARLVPRGRAVGLDPWKAGDQSGNSPEATRRNLDVEGVGDRCSVVTADMRTMPFRDATFSVVVSNLAIHNVRRHGGRLQAMDEAVRVLEPGGSLLVADLMWTGTYARHLRERGMEAVERRGLGWQFWYGGPWLAWVPRLVAAKKPAASPGLVGVHE